MICYNIVMDKTKKIMIFSAVVLILVIAAGIWYWFVWRQAAKVELLPTYLSESASQALETAQNPVEKVAETNPFKNEETNPIINIYKNPFE